MYITWQNLLFELDEVQVNCDMLSDIESLSVQTLQESLEDNEALLEEYGMKVKAWSDVPRTVKTLREQNDALAEKEEALKERDKALREKDELVRLMAIMQVSHTFSNIYTKHIL